MSAVSVNGVGCSNFSNTGASSNLFSSPVESCVKSLARGLFTLKRPCLVSVPSYSDLTQESTPKVSEPAMALLRQNYIRGKKIGQGAHGSVYEAILVSETKTDDKRRPLVLKQAVGEKHSNELRHECEMLKLIEGKCAPEFVDAAFQGEEGEMVMTLAGEQTLKKYFNNHVDGEKQQIVLKQVACEVMDGLEEIHKKGACHRDLKPDNIMITSESGVIVDLKLVDFGEATNNMKNPGEDSFGAVAFRIPDSENKTAAEIDLYSLGMTLRALSAGNSDDWNMDPFDAYSERNNYLNREDKNQKSTFESFTKYLTCEPGITIEMARSHPWLQNQSQPRSQG